MISRSFWKRLAESLHPQEVVVMERTAALFASTVEDNAAATAIQETDAAVAALVNQSPQSSHQEIPIWNQIPSVSLEVKATE